MKQKNHLILIFGFAAATVGALVFAVNLIGSKDSSKTESDISTKPVDSSNYVTYTVDFEDGYKLYFDYLPNLTELKTRKILGIASKDFGIGNTMITAVHVPPELNSDPNRPRTPEAYIETRQEADFCDALPYENGDTKGFAYWEKNVRSYGSGYIQGYQLFVGDEYFYIFVSSNKVWSQNITNVRIVKE